MIPARKAPGYSHFFRTSFTVRMFSSTVKRISYPGEGQAVDALRASLIGGAGVVGQNADGGVPLVLREQGQKRGREADVQQKIPGGIRKAAGGIRWQSP